jgi:hypothetical protein
VRINVSDVSQEGTISVSHLYAEARRETGPIERDVLLSSHVPRLSPIWRGDRKRGQSLIYSDSTGAYRSSAAEALHLIERYRFCRWSYIRTTRTFR